MTYHSGAADHITTLQYPADDAEYSVGGTLGEIVAQSYDLLGRLEGVESTTYGTSYVAGLAYAHTGQVLEQTLGSGAGAVARSYSYETGSLRLLGLTSAVTTTVQSLAYTYDDVGNVVSVTDAVNAGQVQTFGYDALDRLTAAATDTAGVGQYEHDYGYDAIGNITALDGITYTYGLGQPHAVTGVGNDSYQYDDNGNMTVRAVGGITYTLTYDRENRLTGVTGPNTSATFLYDADGNRVLATVDGETTAYIGGVYEHTDTGASTSTYAGSVIRRSGYANDNGVFTVLGDHLGSTSVLVDASGSVVAQQYYYPYGANRGSAQSDLTERRYTGQYQETGLAGAEGLYYYNARWYDPALGRFVQADTIVPSPGNPQALNRYAYVYNNPQRYDDPSGHIPVPVIAALVGAGAGGFIAYVPQVRQNLRSGQSFGEAALNVDWGKVAGAAVGGALAGATMGLGTSAGVGLGGTLLLGGIGGAAGGQAATLTEASITQLGGWTGSSNWDSAQFAEDASRLGFLDPSSMAYDAAGGVLAAGVGYAAGRVVEPVLGRLGDQVVEGGVSTIRGSPAGLGGPRYYPVWEGRTVVIPAGAFERVMKGFAAGLYAWSSDTLQILVDTESQRWLRQRSDRAVTPTLR